MDQVCRKVTIVSSLDYVLVHKVTQSNRPYGPFYRKRCIFASPLQLYCLENLGSKANLLTVLEGLLLIRLASLLTLAFGPETTYE